MENSFNKFKLIKILGIVSIGTLTFGVFYFLFNKFFNDKESEFINDYISTSLADIRNQIQEANGNFDEGLKKKIFLKINQTHEKIMKIRFDFFIKNII